MNPHEDGLAFLADLGFRPDVEREAVFALGNTIGAVAARLHARESLVGDDIRKAVLQARYEEGILT